MAIEFQPQHEFNDTNASPQSRWQFSLRSMFLLMTTVAACGMFAYFGCRPYLPILVVTALLAMMQLAGSLSVHWEFNRSRFSKRTVLSIFLWLTIVELQLAIVVGFFSQGASGGYPWIFLAVLLAASALLFVIAWQRRRAGADSK